MYSIPIFSEYFQYPLVMCFNLPLFTNCLPNSAKAKRKSNRVVTSERWKWSKSCWEVFFFPPPVFNRAHPLRHYRVLDYWVPVLLLVTSINKRGDYLMDSRCSLLDQERRVYTKRVCYKNNASLESFPQLPHFRLSRLYSYFRVRDTAPPMPKNWSKNKYF